MKNFELGGWKLGVLMFLVLVWFSYKLWFDTNEQSILFGIRSLICFGFVVFGRWLNILVCDLNGGKMPFLLPNFKIWRFNVKTQTAEKDDNHIKFNEKTRAIILGDIFPIFFPTLSMISIGDLLQIFGVGAMAVLVLQSLIS